MKFQKKYDRYNIRRIVYDREPNLGRWGTLCRSTCSWPSFRQRICRSPCPETEVCWWRACPNRFWFSRWTCWRPSNGRRSRSSSARRSRAEGSLWRGRRKCGSCPRTRWHWRGPGLFPELRGRKGHQTKEERKRNILRTLELITEGDRIVIVRRESMAMAENIVRN